MVREPVQHARLRTRPSCLSTVNSQFLAALCGRAVVYGVTNALIEGPKLRALADQAKAQEIDQATAVFCRKHACRPAATTIPPAPSP